MDEIDWSDPDYAAVFRRRAERLARMRADPDLLPGLRAFYRGHIAQFITDWGCTTDPRLVERGLPALVPFVLFPRQKEWVGYLLDHWRRGRDFLTEKSRDMGMSWLAVGCAATLCLFEDGMAVGFGSRKEEYVDRIGSPKSLFHKCREFVRLLPREFRGGWDPRRDAPHMRINFPDTGSHISGEAGSNIGRGDRTGIYFVDEGAYLEQPELVELSLSQTTNCRVDISSANGMANPFAQKRHSGKVDVFTYHWRDDPRKSQAWYDREVADLDPVIVAQEIDIDYQASSEGQLIPAAWVQAAVDLHVRLNFAPTGAKTASLDVADEGRDRNAFLGARGPLVEVLEEWAGIGSDIFATTQRAFKLCDDGGYALLRYDADGLGAGVRGDARIINGHRDRKKQLLVRAFRGSEAVEEPEKEDVRGRANEDFFANRKAQAWWSLRARFQNAHRAVHDGVVMSHDDLISLPSGLPLLGRLTVELSQPTYHLNPVGKVIVDKTPDGVKSPNLADALMIQFSGHRRRGVAVTAAALGRMTVAGLARGQRRAA
jgi:hypothetical protein